MIKKQDNGKWKADIQIGREGKRYRKTFTTKAEAVRWESYIRAQHAKTPEWNPDKTDPRRLAELIERWYELHGKALKDAEHRKATLDAVCSTIGNPIASQMKPAHFTAYRSEATVKPNTLNRHLSYLKAVFNELIRLEDWHNRNPLENVKPLKVDELALSYLTDNQIKDLLSALNTPRRTHARLVTMICLSTGARWSEAESLTAEQIQPYRITYAGTKSGKTRTVPISPELYKQIKICPAGQLFNGCYDAFSGALEESGIELPRGQRTHVLRHTFASHFMMNGGNLLTLQKILGHASITMTMRYAHLAPEHLIEATRLNPLAKFVDTKSTHDANE